MNGTIAVAGSLAQRPHRGGHAWVFIQYLLGLRRLGWDVVFIDRLEPDMCVDAAGTRTSLERSVNLAYLAAVMKRFDLGQCWSLLFDGGRRVVGMDRARLLDRLGNSALLLNFMGFMDDEEVMGAVPVRVFLDIDPGFGQMWRALGLHDMFRNHDRYVTIGENIGMEDCTIPTCGIEWITTKQPVVLDEWPATAPANGPITSVASWRGPFEPLEYEGRRYGLRVHEFRRFASLPRLTGATFEVALDIHEAEAGDLRLLRENGWQLVDPLEVAGDPDQYREYIRQSGAEVMIAKNMYVQSNSGWFSDRSICYLASGRPVIAQDTGLASLLPTGEGLLTFSTIEEAADAFAAISAEPAHAAAARGIAEDHFSSDVVLPRLLARLEVA